MMAQQWRLVVVVAQLWCLGVVGAVVLQSQLNNLIAGDVPIVGGIVPELPSVFLSPACHATFRQHGTRVGQTQSNAHRCRNA